MKTFTITAYEFGNLEGFVGLIESDADDKSAMDAVEYASMRIDPDEDKNDFIRLVLERLKEKGFKASIPDYTTLWTEP